MTLVSSFSSHASGGSVYKYERKLASVTKQYTEQVRQCQRHQRQQRESLQQAADLLAHGAESSNSRAFKRKKVSSDSCYGTVAHAHYSVRNATSYGVSDDEEMLSRGKVV